MRLEYTQQLIAEQQRVLELLQQEEQIRRQNLQQLAIDAGEIEQDVVDEEEELGERRRVQEQLEAKQSLYTTSVSESSYLATTQPKLSGACRKKHCWRV